MRFQLTALLALSSASLTIASPTWQAVQEWAKGSGGKHAPEHTSPRRHISCHPKTPHHPIPSPPVRNKVCYVKSYNDSITDDSTYILDALHKCNNGGHVVFKEGVKYTIGTALDLTFLNHVDIGVLKPAQSKSSIANRLQMSSHTSSSPTTQHTGKRIRSDSCSRTSHLSSSSEETT